MQEAYGLTAADRVLQKTPASFDVSVWEFFWPFAAGAGLVVADPGGHRDPAYLARLIAEQDVSTVHFVPSMLRAFLEDPAVAAAPVPPSLRRVFASGEALGSDAAERFAEVLPEVGLHNLYGPTEAAVDVTYFDVLRPAAGTLPDGGAGARPAAPRRSPAGEDVRGSTGPGAAGAAGAAGAGGPLLGRPPGGRRHPPGRERRGAAGRAPALPGRRRRPRFDRPGRGGRRRDRRRGLLRHRRFGADRAAGVEHPGLRAGRGAAAGPARRPGRALPRRGAVGPRLRRPPRPVRGPVRGLP